jgi:hypothetical protein
VEIKMRRLYFVEMDDFKNEAQLARFDAEYGVIVLNTSHPEYQRILNNPSSQICLKADLAVKVDEALFPPEEWESEEDLTKKRRELFDFFKKYFKGE